MNTTPYRVLAAMAFLVAVSAFAAELVRWEFKSDAANNAVQRYQAAYAEAEAEHKRKREALDAKHGGLMTELRAELLQNLEAAKESAMRGKNLKEAVALDGAIEELKQNQPQERPGDDDDAVPGVDRVAPDGFVMHPTAALVEKLTGTRWAFDEGNPTVPWIEFLPSNVLRVSNHDEGGMWAAVDGRTLRFTPYPRSRAIVEWRIDDRGRVTNADGTRVMTQWPK